MTFVVDGAVDAATRNSFYQVVKSSRLLSKFLGFIESLPYKSSSIYSDHLINCHVKLRRQIEPKFNVKKVLETSIVTNTMILCIPWLTKYLSMLDCVTLRLPYYHDVIKTLLLFYKSLNNQFPQKSIYFIKFNLGWLFELPHFPETDHLNLEISHFPDNKPEKTGLDYLEIVDQNVLYLCCPYLNEIKKIFTTNSVVNTPTIKHITPVTALEPPELIAKKKLQVCTRSIQIWRLKIELVALVTRHVWLFVT